MQFTKLIRFTAGNNEGGGREAAAKEQGLVEWDWIGEDSPLVANESEAEFVLDRLCESLSRYLGRVASSNPGSSKEETSDKVGRERESGDGTEDGDGGSDSEDSMPRLETPNDSLDDDDGDAQGWDEEEFVRTVRNLLLRCTV